jgi:hypothetical protein
MNSQLQHDYYKSVGRLTANGGLLGEYLNPIDKIFVIASEIKHSRSLDKWQMERP